jgi:Bifunctional DNA primase/polymerase, N-terminal/AAA domain
MNVSSHNLQVALKCQQAGLFVFVAGPDKKALVKWRDASTTDPDQIKKWFKRWPDSLPAIDLPKSGHIVLDGDRHGGPDGVAAAEQLFAERSLNAAAIPTVITPQDGRHYWFTQPTEGEPLGNSNKQISDKGIDVRGAGGYVIAPGSRLPDGREYKRDPNTPSALEAVQARTVPALPPSIEKLLRGHSPAQMPLHNGAKYSPASSREERYAQVALNNIAQEIASKPPNTGRNNELNNGAFTMGRMVASGWIGRATVESRLFSAAMACGLVEDDGQHSVRATIKSGLDAGEKEPHAPLPEREYGGSGDVPQWSPSPSITPDPHADGHASDDAESLIKTSKQFVANFLPPDYIVDGLLQEGFLYSLTGATGAGKTAITLRLAASTALGVIFAGRETKRRRVLYLAAENPDDVRMRWIALSQHMHFEIDAIEVFFVEGVFKISEAKDRLRKEAEKLGGDFGLVIIDTSPVFYEGDDENNRTQQGQHAVMLRELISVIPGKPAVIANCHPVKNASSDNLLPAGGGNFLNQVDGNLTAAKTDSTTELHTQGKFRGVEFAPMHFLIKTVTHQDVKDSRGRLIPTVICEWVSDKEKENLAIQVMSDEDAVLKIIRDDPKATQPSIATKMGWKLHSGEPNKMKAGRCVKALLKDKLIKETRRGNYVLTDDGQKALVEQK